MDSSLRRRFVLSNMEISPIQMIRQISRPPQSPCPQVPDITEGTGLEWFEIATSTGPLSSDQDVPRSPCLTGSVSGGVQCSPVSNFTVPCTPVQRSWRLLLSQEEGLCRGSPACYSTISPLAQTVPVLGKRSVVDETHLSRNPGSPQTHPREEALAKRRK